MGEIGEAFEDAEEVLVPAASPDLDVAAAALRTERSEPAPRHHFRAAVMAIAADGDVRLRPVSADALDETAQMAAYLFARGRLAGAQQDGDRPGGRRVIDVDRRKQRSS